MASGEKNGGGAPSKLTAETVERFLHYLSVGNYPEPACRAVGIEPRTYYNWMARGEREGKGQFFQFFQRVQQALAECEMRLVEQWHNATPLDWKAGQALVGRRYRDRWGQTETQPNDVVVNITHADADKHTVTKSARRTDGNKRKPS